MTRIPEYNNQPNTLKMDKLFAASSLLTKFGKLHLAEIAKTQKLAIEKRREEGWMPLPNPCCENQKAAFVHIHQLMEWILKNTTGKWDMNEHDEIRFDEPKDAMLFKLTWCGE